MYFGREYERPIWYGCWMIYPSHKLAQNNVNGNWANWVEKDGLVHWVQTVNVPEIYFKQLGEWLIARHTNFI